MYYTNDAIQRLIDKDAIRSVLERYARANDRMDRTIYESCFHPGARVHRDGIFDGTIEEYLETVLPALTARSATLHLIANQSIQISGDRASSEAYGLAFLVSPPPGASNVIYCQRYIDHLERREGEWRISERWSLREMTITAPDLTVNGASPAIARDEQDPSYWTSWCRPDLRGESGREVDSHG